MNNFVYVWLIIKGWTKNIAYMKIGKILYISFLRSFIKKKIDDPEKQWDEKAMEALDEIFNCKKE